MIYSTSGIRAIPLTSDKCVMNIMPLYACSFWNGTIAIVNGRAWIIIVFATFSMQILHIYIYIYIFTFILSPNKQQLPQDFLWKERSRQTLYCFLLGRKPYQEYNVSLKDSRNNVKSVRATTCVLQTWPKGSRYNLTGIVSFNKG